MYIYIGQNDDSEEGGGGWVAYQGAALLKYTYVDVNCSQKGCVRCGCACAFTVFCTFFQNFHYPAREWNLELMIPATFNLELIMPGHHLIDN